MTLLFSGKDNHLSDYLKKQDRVSDTDREFEYISAERPKMIEMIASHIAEGINAIQAPTSIFYWPYMLGSYILTVLALIFYHRTPLPKLWATLFPGDIWKSKSAVTDVVISILYMLFFNVPTGLLQGWIAFKSYSFIDNQMLGQYYFAYAQNWGPIIEGIIACGVIILSFDFATYIGHRLMHAIPFLWDIHVVHHSPEKLNLFSAYRQNPLDRVVRNSLAAVFTGSSMALMHFLFPAGTTSAMIMGAGAGFFLFMLTVHLQHSHIPIHYPNWLGKLVLSPHLHQIHHSSLSRHHDKNFGGIFPYWDKMFGTYCDEKLEFGTLKFGVDVDPIRHSIIRCYTNPLVMWPLRLSSLLRGKLLAAKAVPEIRSLEPTEEKSDSSCLL